MAATPNRLDAICCRLCCPNAKKTYVSIATRDVELTAAGRDSLITRIEEDPDKNVERWKKLPYLRISRTRALRNRARWCWPKPFRTTAAA